MGLNIPQAVIQTYQKISHSTPIQVREAKKRSPLKQLQDAQSDEQVLESAQRLFALTTRARSPISSRWPDYYDQARGFQWPKGRPKWKSQVVTNYIFASLFSKTALLSDARPEIRALPRKARDRELTEGYINPMLSWLWEFDGLDSKYMETMAGMLLYGTFFWHPFWDPTLDDGKGMLDTEQVDPSYIFPDPGASSITGCEVLCVGRPTSLERLARLYPDGSKVLPEDIPPEFFSARDRGKLYSGLHKPVARKGVFGRFTGHDRTHEDPGTDLDRALAVEVYILQNEPRDVEVEGEKVRLEYPHGRHLVFANGRLLEDLPWDQANFPLIRFRDYMWPLEFWGGGEVEQLKDMQFEMNLQRALISDHMKYMTNGQVIMDKGAVNINLVTNRPGSIIEKRKGHDYKREAGVPLPQGMLQYLQQQQMDFENISGNQEVNQGRVPNRVSSGKAIEMVAEAAQSRIRLTERLAKESLEDWADMALSIIADRMDGDRTIRIIGDDNRPVFRRIRPKMLRRKFDYEAAVGSQILKGRQRLTVTDAAMLLELGVIDEEAVLGVIDFPEAKAVWERVRVQKARRAAEERALVAAQGQGGNLQMVQGGR